MAPTHPELLDHLATQFVRDGWSIKAMHRRIMLSATYQQAAHGSADATTAELYTAFLRRRLSAEEIRDSILAFTQKLQADGHTVEPVDFEFLDFIVPAYYILTTAEASSNLSRYDGVKFGHRNVSKNNSLTDFYCATRSEGFGWEVKRRIMLGTFVLSAGYYDAYFTKAQQVRKLLVDKINLIFSQFDAILLPTAPSTAFTIGEKMEDPISMYLADIFTVFSNLTGIPTISIPLFWHSNGMPYGLQIMTNQFSELYLLQLSQAWMLQFRTAG
jgi:aspartyl-tRNA(Asn)/glutamyl-tRNA(Gln) amidotransferase subunit A